MTRRSFLAAPALLLGQKSADEKLNVLFIASDDLNNSLGMLWASDCQDLRI